jgi:hypothetical protein
MKNIFKRNHGEESSRRGHRKSNHGGIWEASAGTGKASWRLEATDKHNEGVLEAFLGHPP